MIDNLKLSTNNYLWRQRHFDFRVKEAIKQKLQIHDLIATSIATRYKSIEGVEDFVKPSICNSMPNPYHLHDMEKAVKFITETILANKKIALFGDYDVDGATSTALLHNYLRDIGVVTHFHIPDRIKEGYGPNQQALQNFKTAGIDLCILLDCGTVAHAPLKFAHSIGLNIIVIDHHIGAEILPEAIAVINPNRFDQDSTCTNLAAVGVAFLLIVALNTYLDDQIKYFETRKKPDLLQYLDLVALGTVCDIVALTGLNRAFVKQGLKILNKSHNAGIKGMMDHLKLKKRFDVGELGFIIGPRINAGGRIGDASLGTKLLTSTKISDAKNISEQLTGYNEQRKIIEEDALKKAIKDVEKMEIKSLVMLAGNWHPGVSGLVSSRIKDKYNLPSIAISFYEDENIGKASCRSIHGIDIGAAILHAKMKNIILEGGGHHMAAGFSIERHRIQELNDFLENLFSQDLEGMGFYHYRDYDVIANIDQLNIFLNEKLSIIQPFGQGNPAIKFVVENVNIHEAKVFGLNHISCKMRQTNHNINRYIKCTAFGNAIHNPNLILLDNPRNVSLLGSINTNQWNGNEYIEFIVDDIMKADR